MNVEKTAEKESRENEKSWTIGENEDERLGE